MLRLETEEFGRLDFSFSRIAVSSIIGCSCEGNYESFRGIWETKCGRQYFCFELLVKRVSDYDTTNSNVSLYFKHYLGEPKVFDSSDMKKNEWVAIQHEIYGYCDAFEVYNN